MIIDNKSSLNTASLASNLHLPFGGRYLDGKYSPDTICVKIPCSRESRSVLKTRWCNVRFLILGIKLKPVNSQQRCAIFVLKLIHPWGGNTCTLTNWNHPISRQVKPVVCIVFLEQGNKLAHEWQIHAATRTRHHKSINFSVFPQFNI